MYDNADDDNDKYASLCYNGVFLGDDDDQKTERDEKRSKKKKNKIK